MISYRLVGRMASLKIIIIFTFCSLVPSSGHFDQILIFKRLPLELRRDFLSIDVSHGQLKNNYYFYILLFSAL